MSAPVEREGVLLVSVERGGASAVAVEAARAAGVLGEVERRCRWYGPEWFSLRTPGVLDVGLLAELATRPGVRRAVAVLPGAPLYARTPEREVTPVALGAVAVGDGGVTVVAGPCSVEDATGIERVADAAKAAGAHALRGGAYKPRTSPYAYGGLGEVGLRRLAAAGARVGLPTVSEALGVDDVDPVARHADVIQIGARNMNAFPLLFRVGVHPAGRPVLLKRGWAATIDELLLAAEYVLLGRLLAGHPPGGVMLCERGIRTFDQEARFTLDVGAVPILKARSHLPVIVDPSHAAGRRELVAPLALAGVAAGADGLLVEIHPEPASAWSDAEQAIGLDDFVRLMDDVRRYAALRGGAG